MTPESFTTRNAFQLLPWIIALFLGVSSIMSVHGQTYQPSCIHEATYATVEGRGLYVQGGVHSPSAAASQAFVITLSESWNTGSPRYKLLKVGDFNNYSPSGISSDGKRWTVIIGDRGMLYDATTDNWKEIFRLGIQGTYGLTAATDTKNNMMYIPFGYPNADRSRGMLRVNLMNGNTESDYRSYPISQQAYYATAWNPSRNSAIFVGSDGAYEYTWEKGWAKLNSQPDAIPTSGACLVSVSSGEKMVLFGGVTSKGVTGDIFVMDSRTLTWKKGPLVDAKQARKSPACGSTGDQVIIWGGSTSAKELDQVCPTQQVLVFDAKTEKWTNRYVAPGQV